MGQKQKQHYSRNSPHMKQRWNPNFPTSSDHKTSFVHAVETQNIEVDFIAQLRSSNVNTATKLDISPIVVSRNRRIKITKETMKERIFIASPLLKMMTTMDTNHMIAMKVIVPILLHLCQETFFIRSIQES